MTILEKPLPFEGFIRVGGLSVYYRSQGKPAKGTLLALHGGPGGSYDYLTPLLGLEQRGFRVVLYDQSGGGKSEVPKDRSNFTMEHFVEEVEGVRSALDLGKVHLYGHSWGGMLAQGYALKHRKNLRSLTLSGTTPSIPMLESEMEQIFEKLPPKLKAAVNKYEPIGDYQNPEYVAAMDVFNHMYQCRLDPWPETLVYSFNHFSVPVGETMFGLNLVKVTGNMKYWDVTSQLRKLRVPCLVICGDHDFLTPRLHKELHKAIRGSKLVILKGVSHGSMWEAPGPYLGAIEKLLNSA